MKEAVFYKNNLEFENIDKHESAMLSEKSYESKINNENKPNNYKMKLSNSFHTASSTASMKTVKKVKKYKDIKDNINDNENMCSNKCDNENKSESANKSEIENENNLYTFNNIEKRNSSLDKKKSKSIEIVGINYGNLSNKDTILKKLEYRNKNLHLVSKKTKSFNFQTSLKNKKTNNNNKIIIDGMNTVQSEILDYKVGSHTYNNTIKQNLAIDSFNTSNECEMMNEHLSLQCKKYKRKKKRIKKIKSRLFKKSVFYSNYISPDTINLLNQTKLKLTFYQREVDDFLNVIRNLQNIVLIEREKYNELKELLKFTTEEIEKENNKLYEELNLYKYKYSKLKSLISNIGYGIFFNINDKETNHKLNHKDNANVNYEKAYDPEENENEYVVVNKKMNSFNDHFDNKHNKKFHNSNHSSLLTYLDF